MRRNPSGGRCRSSTKEKRKMKRMIIKQRHGEFLDDWAKRVEQETGKKIARAWRSYCINVAVTEDGVAIFGM